MTSPGGLYNGLTYEAGDRLILNACACLTDVFGEDRVFRIGGDEFLVICTQIDGLKGEDE